MSFSLRSEPLQGPEKQGESRRETVAADQGEVGGVFRAEGEGEVNRLSQYVDQTADRRTPRGQADDYKGYPSQGPVVKTPIIGKTTRLVMGLVFSSASATVMTQLRALFW